MRSRAGQIHLDPVAQGATAWLAGGTDGAAPMAEDYLGTSPPEEAESGLRADRRPLFTFFGAATVCLARNRWRRQATPQPCLPTARRRPDRKSSRSSKLRK